MNQRGEDHGESQSGILANAEGDALGALSIVEARFGGVAVRGAASSTVDRILGGDPSFETAVEVVDGGDHGDELVHAERDVGGVFEGMESHEIVHFANGGDVVPNGIGDGVG